MVTKYTPETVKELSLTIEQTGDIARACAYARISEDTYDRWVKKYPDFARQMEEAAETYERNSPGRQYVLASQALTDALEGKRKTSWTKRKVVVTETLDLDHNVIAVERVTTTETYEQLLPVPSWAISRAMPKPVYSLVQLNAIAAEYGLKLTVADEYLLDAHIQSGKDDWN